MPTATVNLLKKERHAFIIRQVNLHNKVLSSDLSLQLGVSEDTVRRDLNELADEQKILKVHGGALSKSFHFAHQQTDIYAIDAKKTVAVKAHQLIHDGAVVLTGGGTTMIELAKSLPAELNATFFTISPLVALELAEHPHIDVILIGGQLCKTSQVSVGAQVISFLADIKVDLCFLGNNGFSVPDGMTDSDLEIVHVKKAMIKSANKLIVLSISEKLDSVQRMKVCKTSQVSGLITELNRDDDFLKTYRQQGIELY